MHRHPKRPYSLRRRCISMLLFWPIMRGACLTLPAETIHLKNGHRIKADIIHKKSDQVIVDLGFTILSVPTRDIDHISADDHAPAREDPDETALYRTSQGQGEFTVKELVERCGEAVVLIRTTTALGSGFLIHPSGYLITNDHVIAGEHDITVTLFKMTKLEMEKIQFPKIRIVATSPQIDLALLKIEEEEGRTFQTVNIGDSDLLRQGQEVFAIGSPLGLDRTVSRGIVSLKNRPMDGRLYIQTTTQINAGNSGGPLFNLHGDVVGINNMKRMAIGVEGVAYAIPSNTLKMFLRNRDAFAFDPRNPNAGFRYLSPPRTAQKTGVEG